MESIQLSEGEFWKMRALASEAMRLRQDANLTPQALEAVVAERRAIEAVDALATKYGFASTLDLRFDEASLTLVPVTPQTPPK